MINIVQIHSTKYHRPILDTIFDSKFTIGRWFWNHFVVCAKSNNVKCKFSLLSWSNMKFQFQTRQAPSWDNCFYFGQIQRKILKCWKRINDGGLLLLKIYFLAFSTDMTKIVPSITFLLVPVVLQHPILHTVTLFSIDTDIEFELASNLIYRKIWPFSLNFTQYYKSTFLSQLNAT